MFRQVRQYGNKSSYGIVSVAEYLQLTWQTLAGRRWKHASSCDTKPFDNSS